MKESVGIIGLGRFGRVLANILSDDYRVRAVEPNPQNDVFGVELVDWNTVLQEQTIFVAVPIHSFKAVIHQLANDLTQDVTIIDVCSVKVYPATVMKEHLSERVGIIATHPLFGPDSINSNEGLKIMMHNTREVYNQYAKWKTYFQSKAIRVVEMSPEQHDRTAAKTQGITHFIGRVLRDAGINSTDIDTLGFHELVQVIDQTCNDSWELFMDLQNYNPYTLSVIQQLETSINVIRSKILKGA